MIESSKTEEGPQMPCSMLNTCPGRIVLYLAAQTEEGVCVPLGLVLCRLQDSVCTNVRMERWSGTGGRRVCSGNNVLSFWKSGGQMLSLRVKDAMDTTLCEGTLIKSLKSFETKVF